MTGRHAGKPRLIVTIDGPAGTGKSSVASQLAKRLDLDFLDTGAMYRAVAAVAIDREIDWQDHNSVVDVAVDSDMHFDFSTDPPELIAYGAPVTRRLRDADVTGLVSSIAGIPGLRRYLVRQQRMIAASHPRLVTEGRDQGSVAFPDAEAKFYLDATPAVRARRRADQLRAAGRSVDEAVLCREIIERDRSDSTRADGPLMCADNARRIDTSSLSLEQVVDVLEKLVRLSGAGVDPGTGGTGEAVAESGSVRFVSPGVRADRS
ncbi:MAG: (d)CMP kinase [Phycisphaerales bacterium]|nr:(d)CMP kinase [Phycisphaerales bacterium]